MQFFFDRKKSNDEISKRFIESWVNELDFSFQFFINILHIASSIPHIFAVYHHHNTTVFTMVKVFIHSINIVESIGKLKLHIKGNEQSLGTQLNRVAAINRLQKTATNPLF